MSQPQGSQFLADLVIKALAYFFGTFMHCDCGYGRASQQCNSHFLGCSQVPLLVAATLLTKTRLFSQKNGCGLDWD